MNSILAKIAEQKRQDVALAKQQRSLSSLQTTDLPPVRDFVQALKVNNPAIIAEIKKASPSKGLIRADFDVAAIAQIYEAYGAACLSVLTDKPFFQGDAVNVHIARTHSSLPVLRKEFIIDSYQVFESRALGADCILLIVALLDDIQLRDYCQIAQELGMAVLVESHTREELERALRLPTPLMGINNRSLHTFKTDIHTSIDLKDLLPSDKCLITESGINSRADIELMQRHGINTFLIGESLMRMPDIGAKLDELMGKNG
ncbi:indole-3-glycerol phosphate synthase TrpC [Legionella taurinensis]|uniref:Indole-3-glycerol phosphate synthase n=1 Tax=Legionella taurinensis TaxID=70611 RepID=A0A3A5LLZ5_9GAMM|nr:indole-3-glycerol phosphate synthase TrpC [Legionella taurinensis]RJT49466.1 indole-3-glycerol phosphate synthase TrpC [Legionella taurinensis]RJT69499.1 indole-3-glycerol phosphate synthase TrpC [Legionella taurinensis]STY26631.1 indole-3-glycerol phosphate synthase [Legionella taurinensis]